MCNHSLKACSKEINIPEKLLLTELKNGDQNAFNILYFRYNINIYRKFLRMTKTQVNAEELTQKLFIKIWNNREKIDVLQPFGAYINSIAKNLIIDFYRKTIRDKKLAEEVFLKALNIADSVEEIKIKKDNEFLIKNMIDNLPIRQGRIFRLCKIDGYSYREVGELLGISTATVNNHIVNATKLIKKNLSKYTFLLSFVIAFCIAAKK